MTDIGSVADNASVTPLGSSVPRESTPGQPQETLEIEEPSGAQEDVQYLSGIKLVASTAAVLASMVMVGVDSTILSTAIPKITDDFKSVKDIGWYSSLFRFMICSFLFMFGKLYTITSLKWTFLSCLAIFEVGSLLCTVAPNSATFILGRAVSGFATSGIIGGAFAVLTQSVPLRQRPLLGGLAGGVETLSMVSGPLLGGILTDRLGWRACFGINLPIGGVGVLLMLFFFQNPRENPNASLPLKDKLKKLDLLSTAIFVPSIVCLLLALQWGGVTYAWADAKIILLLVVSAISLIGFGYLQYRRGEDAVLPPRILKQRSIIAGAWFASCCNATAAVVEFYIAIYWQAVKGYSPTKSGVLMVPQIVGLCIACVMAGTGTTLIGYYFPFMFITSIIGPIAAGLLTRLSLDTKLISLLCYQALLGFGIGLGIQAPQIAAQTVLSETEATIGISVVMFGQQLGPALFLAVAQTLFQTRLTAELQAVPSANVTAIEGMGLSDVRNQIGHDKLKKVLLGYDDAVIQSLYLPVALMCLTLLGSLGMEWRSVKKKQT